MNNANIVPYRAKADDQIISEALAILERRVNKGQALTSPQDTRSFFAVRLASLEYEVFGVLFLDSRHRVLAFEEMFRGTLNGTSVYPREVAKRALEWNAAAVIFTHNHPSGIPEPSRADEVLTARLKECLSPLDIRVLDHVIVGGGQSVSFAERGLL